MGDDILVSHPQFSVLMTAEREIIVNDFERVTANSISGFDQAFVFDSIGVDEIFTDMNSVEIAVGESSRSFSGYSEFELDSTSGLDELVVQAPAGFETIFVSPNSIEMFLAQEQFRFLNVPKASFFADEGAFHHVEIIGNEQDESVLISPAGSSYSGEDFDYNFSPDYRSIASLSESGGSDELIFRDTTGNESLVVNGLSLIHI